MSLQVALDVWKTAILAQINTIACEAMGIEDLNKITKKFSTFNTEVAKFMTTKMKNV